jgi:hypothetical protein
MTNIILKSLSEEGDWVVNTYSKVFKFDISCENIQRMISHMIDKLHYA